MELPQTDSLSFDWSTTSPTSPQKSSAEPIQSTAHKLIIAPNPNKPQKILLTNNLATARDITIPNQTNLHNLNLTSKEFHSTTSLNPQSVYAPSLTTHKSWTNSYTLPLTNPLFAFSHSSFPSKQSMTTTDNRSPSFRTPIHQRLTLPSSPHQFITPPYNSHEELQKSNFLPFCTNPFYETRDTNKPRTYLHAILYNHTINRLYMQETPYHFQIPALDYTKDQLYSRGSKTTKPYDFSFKNDSSLKHLQLNCIKANKQ